MEDHLPRYLDQLCFTLEFLTNHLSLSYTHSRLLFQSPLSLCTCQTPYLNARARPKWSKMHLA